MEKRCWARGSGRGGSRAGVDATGRGGTAHNGLPSKGPATALVSGLGEHINQFTKAPGAQGRGTKSFLTLCNPTD